MKKNTIFKNIGITTEKNGKSIPMLESELRTIQQLLEPKAAILITNFIL